LPENQNPDQNGDPILQTSYTGAILISSFLLILTLAWSLYQEMFGLRPWRGYQSHFVAAYAKYLKKEMPKQKAAEDAIKQSAEYRKMDEAAASAGKAAEARGKEIAAERAFVDRRLLALMDTFTTERGRVTAAFHTGRRDGDGERSNSTDFLCQPRSDQCAGSLPGAGRQRDCRGETGWQRGWLKRYHRAECCSGFVPFERRASGGVESGWQCEQPIESGRGRERDLRVSDRTGSSGSRGCNRRGGVRESTLAGERKCQRVYWWAIGAGDVCGTRARIRGIVSGEHSCAAGSGRE